MAHGMMENKVKLTKRQLRRITQEAILIIGDVT
jgi:hypothetical protein